MFSIPRIVKSPCKVALYAAMAVLAALSVQVHAQQLPVLQDPAQRLLQDQQQQQRQRELEQEPAQISAPQQQTQPSLPPNLPPDADIDTLPDAEPTFLIERINVAGNTVLNDKEVQGITQAFIGKRLGTNRINLLLRRFTEAFVAHGFITTRAYVGQQNLKDGILTITVVPGKVEAIVVNGKTLSPDSGKPGTVNGGLLTDQGTLLASPVRVGDVLNIADVEQGVDQINRLRRNQAEMQILPGNAPGDSIISMTNRPADSFRYSIGKDNYGSSATGIARTRFEVDADNLTGMQEALSATYIGTLDTNALVGSVSVPVGYNTFSYTVSWSEYQIAIGTTALLYGTSLAHVFGWDRVIERSQAGKTAIDATLTHRRADRSINNLALDPQDMTVLRLGLDRQRRFGFNGQTAAWSLDGGYSRGLRMEANADGSDIAADEAHNQFDKLDLSGMLTLPLGSVGGTSWLWRAQGYGQWTQQALFGSEQIFAGGMTSVRGFRSGVISGDRGFYWSNDLIWSNVPQWANLQVQPYAFLDGARTQLIATSQYQQIMGAGFGVRLQGNIRKQQVTAEITAGIPLQQPAVLGPKAALVLATVNWTY